MAGTKISAATDGGSSVTTDRIPIYRIGQAGSDKFYQTPVEILAAANGTTQSVGDSSLKIATTAFASVAAFNAAYTASTLRL